MPVYQDDDISKAVSAARQPNLVTEDDVAGTWSPRSNPTQGQTVNSYSPATEVAPKNFMEKLPGVLYNHFVDPMVKAVTAPGRVYRGEVPEDQMIDEAKNMAGQVMLGSFGVGVPSALREGIDPNVLRTFAGPASKTADIYAQRKAGLLKDVYNASPEDIWRQTKWMQDPAKLNWMYEIKDPSFAEAIGSNLVDEKGYEQASKDWVNLIPKRKDATEIAGDYYEQYLGLPRSKMFTGQNTELDNQALAFARAYPDTSSIKLGNLINHSELFSAYPELAEMPIYKENRTAGLFGSYNPEFHEITVGGTDEFYRPQNSHDTYSTLLHEINHAISHREGRPVGGNPQYANQLQGTIIDKKLGLLNDQIDDINNQLSKIDKSSKEAEDLTQQKWNIVDRKKELINSFVKPYEAYQRLQDEVLSRLVQKRHGLLASDVYFPLSENPKEFGMDRPVSQQLIHDDWGFPHWGKASGGRTLGNNAIDNALRLATGGRAHFGFGGDTESEGSSPERGETGTVSAGRSADSFQGDPRGNERGFADRSGQGSDAQVGAGLGADQPSSRGLNPRGDEGMMPDTSPGWSGISNARQKMLDDILNHTTQVETGSDPSAYNKKSGAFGAYQLMPKTALDVLGKSFPDLTTRPSVATQNPADVAMGMPFNPNPVPLTKEEQLREVTMNPDLQKQIAQSLTAQNMIALGPRFSSSGDVYTAHLLGAGDALKVLNSDPNTPLEQTGIDPRAIEANRLNGLTAGQLLARNESKMTAPIPGNEAVTVGGRGLVAGNDSINSGARILDAYSPDAISKAKAAASDQYTSVGNDWSKGSFKGDTANVAEKERLYNAGNPILGAGVANTVTGDSVESYAAKFGIDPSQVQSRITNMNGIPQVELYSKDLGEKFGEALGAISKDVGSMFGSKQNYDPLTGQYRPEMSSSVGRDTSDSGQVRGSDNRGAYYNPQIQEARNTAMGMFSRRTAPYMSELGAYNQQLPSVTGETAEQWAAANTGGDLSKVHGRIKYVNGAPRLEYFTQ